MQQKTELLVVDDEALNREILKECLTEAGYEVTLAKDGEEAWEILTRHGERFSSVLLDRMMPRLDGMGLLKRIRDDAALSILPVIFQTAADSPEDVASGLEAGAYYYLTKPVRPTDLLAIVKAAVSDYSLTKGLFENAWVTQNCLRLLEHAKFTFSSLVQAKQLSHVIASLYPDPQRVFLGLSELMINAVEHGNLGITYQEKSELVRQNKWDDEVERRLALPENKEKQVSVVMQRDSESLQLRIVDQGSGFDWQHYLEFSPTRAFDPNGRGIALSRRISFDQLEYLGKGNEVLAVIKLVN